MIRLLIDTSSHRLSIAIAKDTEVIAAIDEVAFQTQSEILIERIHELLRSCDLTPSSINAIGVAYGPGSYTGVRIGVSVAKVWAYAKDIPLYGFSSLAIFAHESKPTIGVLDARSGRSFIGVYMQSEVILKDQIMVNESVLELSKEHGYLISGETNHLGLVSEPFDRFTNMIKLMNEENRVVNVNAFKPVYLKG